MQPVRQLYWKERIRKISAFLFLRVSLVHVSSIDLYFLSRLIERETFNRPIRTYKKPRSQETWSKCGWMQPNSFFLFVFSFFKTNCDHIKHALLSSFSWCSNLIRNSKRHEKGSIEAYEDRYKFDWNVNTTNNAEFRDTFEGVKILWQSCNATIFQKNKKRVGGNEEIRKMVRNQETCR